MTLIIIGRCFKTFDGLDYEDVLFAVSDSNITQDNQVLVNGFEKVLEIPITIKIPIINHDGRFNGQYNANPIKRSCLLAFAGSTLASQHIINSISEHLGNLYIGITYHKLLYTYDVVMHSESEKHLSCDDRYDYYEFSKVRANLTSFLSGEYISQVVNHSIQVVLDKPKKHGRMKSLFAPNQAEFILGIKTIGVNKYEDEYKLYRFEIPQSTSGEAFSKKVEINKDEVAVIGMRKNYIQQANDKFKDLKDSNQDIPTGMLSFLSEIVDTENKKSSKKIGKPCFLYKYKGARVEKISCIEED